MGTRHLTSRLSTTVVAHIALGSLQNGQAGFLINLIASLFVFLRLHANVVVGAAFRATFAADTGAFVNLNLATRLRAMNRSRRTADHAYGILAMHAGLRKEPLAILRTPSFEQRTIVVSCRTGADAVIASRATLGIDDHRLSTVHQTLIYQELEKTGLKAENIGFRFAVQHRLTKSIAWLGDASGQIHVR